MATTRVMRKPLKVMESTNIDRNEATHGVLKDPNTP